MKMIMNEQTNKANNLRLGAIYINTLSGQPCRLVNVVPCQGVWLESYDGSGYGVTVKFEDVAYADSDEVQDFLDDYAVWMNSNKAPSHKDGIAVECVVGRQTFLPRPSWMSYDGDTLNISDRD